MSPFDYLLPYLVATLATSIVGGLGLLAHEAYRLIRGKLSTEQAKTLDLAAKTAVQFVEQTAIAGTPDEAKLAEATEKANLYLAAHGIPKLDPNLVRVAVESAVLEVKVQLAQTPGYAIPSS